MKKFLLLIGLIATAFLAYYTITVFAPRIESDIQGRTSAALEANNISENVKMAVSGRDVVLSGNVATETTKLEAGRIAAAIEGVRAVDNNIEIANAPSFDTGALEMEQPEIIEPELDNVPSLNLDLLSDQDNEIQAMDEMPAMEEQEMALTNIDMKNVEEPNLEMPILEMPSAEMTEAVLEPAPQEAINAIPAEDLMPEPEEAVVVDKVIEDSDAPLKVLSGRITRSDVNLEIAQKTVEAACESDLTSQLQGRKINFESGSATIKSNSYDLLNSIARAARNCDEDTIITINGYTDNVGDLEANRQLSIRRARAVGKYMLKRGVAKQVKVVGHGPNDPIADNATEEGRAKNRRIEFKVFRKGA